MHAAVSASSSQTQTVHGLRRIKQLGVNYLLTSEIHAPWDESSLKAEMARLHGGGLTLRHLYLPGFKAAITGGPGRDEEIQNAIRSIRIAAQWASQCWSTTGTLIALSKATMADGARRLGYYVVRL
jgi:hypothetical protein